MCSGIENLIILKSGDSEFKGYIKDQFTTLKESSDRIMATEMSASWRWSSDDSEALLRLPWYRAAAPFLQCIFVTFGQGRAV